MYVLCGLCLKFCFTLQIRILRIFKKIFLINNICLRWALWVPIHKIGIIIIAIIISNLFQFGLQLVLSETALRIINN